MLWARGGWILIADSALRAQLLQNLVPKEAGHLVPHLGDPSKLLVVWTVRTKLAVPVVAGWCSTMGRRHRDCHLLHRCLGIDHGSSH